MSTFAVRFAACVAALATFIGGLLYIRLLRAEIIAANQQLAAVNEGVASRDRIIRNLRLDANEKARQQAQLDKSTAAASQTVSKQRQAMREAIHDNPTVQSWADTALPDDVMRLSANSACTGAADFSAAMSDDHAVRAPSDVASH